MAPGKTVKDYIRTIVDFPHEGIMFRDVTTLFADARGFRMCIDQLLHPYAGTRIDKIVGLEARGFIIGGALAHQLSVGFVPASTTPRPTRLWTTCVKFSATSSARRDSSCVLRETKTWPRTTTPSKPKKMYMFICLFLFLIDREFRCGI